MAILFETCIPDPMSWNTLIEFLPGAHLLQTWEWARVKEDIGWQPTGCLWREEGDICAAALLLQRSLRFGKHSSGIKILYAPRGPLLDWNNLSLRRVVLDDLQAFARSKGAIFLKVDPDVSLGTGIPGTPTDLPDPLGINVHEDLLQRGWVDSRDQIQFRNTVLIDLRPAEEDILAQMKQKTRYNIRLAEKKGVHIRSGSEADLSTLYHMYAETSLRDRFVIREEDYYLDLWTKFLRSRLAEALIAEVEGVPVAGMVLFRFGQRSWYLYGMSREAHRDKMPNYLLQWEAIRRSKRAGCLVYDLWGAPEIFQEQDSLWGVYRFKEGLGGQVVRWVGAWDYPVYPAVYRLYTQILPRILGFMRRSARARTQQEMMH